jgi:DNA-binding CsgD family transcriptional regulator
VATRAPVLRGRTGECAQLDRALDAVRGGASAVLVIRGEAGIGKSALLGYCAGQAVNCRVAQISGVESELELTFAALHQLCAPMLHALPLLPEPQERALQVAFGLASGTVSDRFVVGLAVLGLLAEVATKEPLVCLIDDAQWLDEGSSQVLGFVGRRLLAESVLLVFAARETRDARLFPDLPDMTIEGLGDADARDLLAATVAGPLDQQVRDRIVAETGGNPLALLELPKGMTRAELAGGFGVPASRTVPGHVEERYRRRIEALPESSRRLMLLAAADPTGDATLVWRAAGMLDIGREAADAADGAQLLEVGPRVRFRHPLVRSAVYTAASPEARRATHRALADATDREIDPDRRAWHLAVAATGHDEDTAAELERTAIRAQTRAGLPTAATFLQRSAALTAEPTRRAERALAAAYAYVQAGAYDAALGLLAHVEADAVDDLQLARAEQLRGQIHWAASPGREAPVALLHAARRLEPLNNALARETYLYAWVASTLAGPLAQPGGHLVEVSRAARSTGAAAAGRPCDLLLDGLIALVLDGRERADADLRRAVDAFVDGAASVDEILQWGLLAQTASIALWDIESYLVLSSRQVELARESGALSPLSIALGGRGAALTWCGDFAAAAGIAEERDAVNAVTGAQSATSHDMFLAGYRGRPSEVLPLVSTTVAGAVARGEGWPVQIANWSTAVLYNGLGQYEHALAAAESACEETYLAVGTQVALPELIEAATRTGKSALAEEAMENLSTMTAIEGADWAAGLDARCRALVSQRADAEDWYREAIDRLHRTPLRPDLARAQLLYGEWLRRENRRVDARQQLRSAFDLFAEMGAQAFAERARRELVATGEKVRKREPGTRNDLTPQEAHIARLARDGRTNLEIGSELFLSARTVEWHLRKMFVKLGISSRRELKDVLPRGGTTSPHDQGRD